MKHILLTSIVVASCAMNATAQVDTSGLFSEELQEGKTYYIVCDNGYFATSKGSQILATDQAPSSAEWRALSPSEGKWTFRNGTRYLVWKEGDSSVTLGDAPQTWDVTSRAYRTGCYTISADIVVDFYGEMIEDYDYLNIWNDGRGIFGYPNWNTPDKSKDTYCADFLFFSELPAQIDNRETGEGDGEDDVVDVPENDIEGDFQANWERNMQDAKVLTYVPMDKTQVVSGYWAPVRRGVTKFEMTIFREDVVSQFYGNKVKNLWFMLPPNASSISFYIMDADERDPEKYILWQDDYDFSETVNYLLSQPNGIIEDEYGKSLNLSLLRDQDTYYKVGQIVGIPCDYEFTSDHRNLQIGYSLTFPGSYKENYKNGKDERGGLYDGIWYSATYMLPTSRYYYALMKGDDDPDGYNGQYEDYTDYTSILKEEYRWTEHAGLFCYVETEGAGGFPHNDIRFDEVKVSRCFTDDSKVPINATFTNYGVDPILSATFDVTIGDNTRRLKFKDGIKFLEQGVLDDDLTPPSEPTRQPMKIVISHINGKEVNIPSAIDGTVVAIDSKDDVKRMPVIEENTGTWCGWCPRGIVGMEKMREEYGEDIALIAIHTGADQKANGMMDQVLGTFGATGAPSCVINRLRMGDPYSGTNGRRYGILDDVEAMRSLITEATVAIDAAVISADGEHVGLRTSTTFSLDSETCPYLLTYVLTEDGLKYATQANYYKTQTDAETTSYYEKNMPELYALTQKPNPWAPTYNDVMEFCSDPMGTEGTLHAPIVRGEAQQTEYVINIPKYTGGKSLVTNLRNCRAIVLLLDRESLEVVNAAQVSLADAPTATEGDDLFSGIGTVLADTPAAPAQSYDLSGRTPVAKDVPGIMIQGGRKIMTKMTK